jgi:TPR repeat protein
MTLREIIRWALGRPDPAYPQMPRESLFTPSRLPKSAAPVKAGKAPKAPKGLNVIPTAAIASTAEITERAHAGEAAAQDELGWMYAIGHGVKQDYAQAVEWFRKAAEQGVVRAQYHLGLMYFRGQAVPRDHAEALKWLRRAAAQGEESAARLVKVIEQPQPAGSALPPAARSAGPPAETIAPPAGAGDAAPAPALEAVGEPQTYTPPEISGSPFGPPPGALAVSPTVIVFTIIAAIGLAVGIIYLAIQQQALSRRAAGESDTARVAENRLDVDPGGQNLPSNLLPPPRPPGAVQITAPPKELPPELHALRDAAERGEAAAQFELGRAYYRGVDVQANFAQAMKWFRHAAERGLPAAMNNLGVMYSRGEGVPQDLVEAYKWFALSARAGNPYGFANLERLSARMTPEQIADAVSRSALMQITKPDAPPPAPAR